MHQFSILGGTGVLGKVTAQLLLEQGYTVKLLVRDPAKAQGFQEKGATIIKGDILNAASLEEVCRDTEVVVAAVHGMLGRGNNRSEKIDDEAHRELINTAVKAGVKQFIYTSVTGASPHHKIDFWRTKYKVEQHLIHSVLNYTILRPSAFMEWHMHNMLGKTVLKTGKLIMPGHGNNPTNFIAASDIAHVIRLAYKNEQFYRQIIELAGPDNLTKNEVASLYASTANKKVKITHIPPSLLKGFSYLLRPFHPGISRILKITAYSDSAPSAMEQEFTVARFGLRPTTAKEFVHEQIE